jgi:hypothetical protein
MVVFWYFCTEDLAALCPKVSVEGAEWFEEQSNKSYKKDEKNCMISDDINDCDCQRLQDDFTAFRTEYQYSVA